jgi:hypothetical protein
MQISYTAEQGIISAEQGIFAREQGISHAKNAPHEPGTKKPGFVCRGSGLSDVEGSAPEYTPEI